MKKLNKINLLLAGVILLSLAMMTSSFAWLSRPSDTEVEGKELNLNTSAVIKSEECTATTYSATMTDGSLIKGAAVTNSDTFTVPAKGAVYFVTEISNLSTAKNNISLTELQLSGVTGDNASVHVLSPTKNYADYSDNMDIVEHAAVEGGGALSVEWYVYNKSDSELTFSFISLPAVSYYG